MKVTYGDLWYFWGCFEDVQWLTYIGDVFEDAQMTYRYWGCFWGCTNDFWILVIFLRMFKDLRRLVIFLKMFRNLFFEDVQWLMEISECSVTYRYWGCFWVCSVTYGGWWYFWGCSGWLSWGWRVGAWCPADAIRGTELAGEGRAPPLSFWLCCFLMTKPTYTSQYCNT